MRRWIILIVLAVGVMPGQYRELLLSQARSIDGLVVGTDGKPLADVRVEHHEYNRQSVLSDVNGRFQLQTRAPALVLRKTGYRSYFLRTAEASHVRIVLVTEKSGGMPGACAANSECQSITGWGSIFCLPSITGVKSSAQGHDADYGIRAYSIETESGPIQLRHGSGPMWSFGIPVDTEVWKSVEYGESSYVQAKLLIRDARGRGADGKRWRYVGIFGESASYSNADEDAAKLFDRMLDGMCLRR